MKKAVPPSVTRPGDLSFLSLGLHLVPGKNLVSLWERLRRSSSPGPYATRARAEGYRRLRRAINSVKKAAPPSVTRPGDLSFLSLGLRLVPGKNLGTL